MADAVDYSLSLLRSCLTPFSKRDLRPAIQMQNDELRMKNVPGSRVSHCHPEKFCSLGNTFRQRRKASCGFSPDETLADKLLRWASAGLD